MASLLRLLRWLEEQPLRDQHSLEKLAGVGWFFGPRMPVAEIPRLGKAAVGAPNEVDAAVSQHVRVHLDTIEATLIETYPHRSHLIQEAFWAHRECKYALSIPVLLSQADGIFHERFGKHLFGRERTGAVSEYSSEVTGRFFQAILHPLRSAIPLWLDTRSPGVTVGDFNRHGVMHGMKVNYNTELNSLKAISLLDHLVWVLNRSDN